MIKKRKKNLIRLIAFILVFTLLSGQAKIRAEDGQEGENQTQQEDTAKAQLINKIMPFEKGDLANRSLEAGDRMIGESKTHQLYFNEETLAIKAQDKQSQYTWSSSVPQEKIEHLSSVWQTFMQSPIVVDYKDLNRASTTNRDYPELESVEVIDNGIQMRLYFPTLKMHLEVQVYLEEDQVHVKVDDESFSYEDGEDRVFELSSIYIMPFWGAVDDEETSGYIFIPDGPGALMRYGKEKPFRSPFQKRVYGRDEGMSRIGIITLLAIPQVGTENIHMPVYGMSHGHQQQASLAYIENGAEFADIFASPAGVKVNFFWTTSIFHYIETYFQPTGKAGKTFPYIYKTPNPVNPHVSFHLLKDKEADYVGMAKRYREVLEDQGQLGNVSSMLADDKDFPLMIHALMAEEERALFFNRNKKMTDIEFLSEQLEDLNALAGNGLVYSLHGAQRKGLSGHPLGKLGISGLVGGKKAFEDLKSQAADKGVRVLLNTDLAVGNEPQIQKGDMLYNVDRGVGWRYTQNPIYDKEYFLDVDAQKRMMENLQEDKYLGDNVGLDLSSIGYTLFSDYQDGILTDRAYVRSEIQKGMEALSENQTVYLDQAHQYLWNAADAIYNVTTMNSQYVYETDTVPFLQIVLSGTTPLFSTYQNFGTQEDDSLLKLIDYNLYPSFLITEKPSSELMDSNTQNVYFSEYEALKPDIKEAYETMKSLLDPVRGEKIIAREIPQEDITVTEYENKMKIITNYTDEDFVYEGTTIEAKTAKLLS